MTLTAANSSARARALPAIFWGGLLSGIFDLTFAFVYYGQRGTTPLRVMQSVAGGLLGKATYQGGVPTAVLGVVLHFIVATSGAAIYYAASRKLGVLVRHALPCGLLYGAVVYFFMNLVVLPLSAYHSVFPPPVDPLALLAHTVGVGPAIALAVRRFSR